MQPDASNERSQNNAISGNLKTDLNVLRKIFCFPSNRDFIVRGLHIMSINRTAVLLFLLGTVDADILQRHVLAPLQEKTITQYDNEDIGTALMKRVVTVKGTGKLSNYREICDRIVNGNAVLLIDGYNQALVFATTGYEHRAVEKPTVENALKGPKEAFTENNETNRSLIRKHVRDEKLMTEGILIGEKTINEVYIMYIKDIADPEILEEVKRRIKNVKVDSIVTLSILEQHIEERSYSLVPTLLGTERPDRVAAFLREGHIALVMDGSPMALIAPVTFWSFFQNPEDYYQRWAYGNFTRLIRIIAIFISLLTPGLFIAVTTFHSDMIPTDLVLAIAATREVLPFPAVVEVLLMEVAFELLREAGVRIPTPIGPTIGIVGALILGQAAVEANIVSPILVIVVAITGLSSFAIPEMSLSFMVRIARFIFFAAGYFMGFYGLAAVFTVVIAYVSSIKSFGVYFLSPVAPHYRSSKDTALRPPMWKMWLRPLNIWPQEKVRQKKEKGS